MSSLFQPYSNGPYDICNLCHVKIKKRSDGSACNVNRHLRLKHSNALVPSYKNNQEEGVEEAQRPVLSTPNVDKLKEFLEKFPSEKSTDRDSSQSISYKINREEEQEDEEAEEDSEDVEEEEEEEMDCSSGEEEGEDEMEEELEEASDEDDGEETDGEEEGEDEMVEEVEEASDEDDGEEPDGEEFERVMKRRQIDPTLPLHVRQIIQRLIDDGEDIDPRYPDYCVLAYRRKYDGYCEK